MHAFQKFEPDLKFLANLNENAEFQTGDQEWVLKQDDYSVEDNVDNGYFFEFVERAIVKVAHNIRDRYIFVFVALKFQLWSDVKKGVHLMFE